MSRRSSRPPARRSPALERAEAFLQRVLPGPDGIDDQSPATPVRGVDERTQGRLEGMGAADRESW